MNVNDLPEPLADGVKEQWRDAESLEEAGFEEDRFGQHMADAVRVYVYSSCGEYEVDVILASGFVMSFNVAHMSIARKRQPE
jgi:hypothetical protein